ncbi:MAG: hypothetical protein HQM00_06595 [Magnetococcales bacterium]|nr:hypothetical protein [Magnetococcales bacterium]
MSNLPKKCLVDTNVPITANLASAPTIPDELFDCVEACVDAVEHIVKHGGLVLDAGDEIFEEYRHKLSLSGQPGMGDRFVKWVHDHRWSLPAEDLVVISKQDDTYQEFPKHSGLRDFDRSDRKFVAVANAHPAKPPILEAMDSKWWGWAEALQQVGITTHFLCPDYAKTKYRKKMGK